jgi:uncharacterized membrane protein
MWERAEMSIMGKEHKKNQVSRRKKMKRIKTFDLLRGLAILAMVIAHRIYS